MTWYDRHSFRSAPCSGLLAFLTCTWYLRDTGVCGQPMVCHRQSPRVCGYDAALPRHPLCGPPHRFLHGGQEPQPSPGSSDGRASYRLSCFRTSRASLSARSTGTPGRRLMFFTASGRTITDSHHQRLGGPPSFSPPHLLGCGQPAQCAWLIATRAGRLRGIGPLSYGTLQATIG